MGWNESREWFKISYSGAKCVGYREKQDWPWDNKAEQWVNRGSLYSTSYICICLNFFIKNFKLVNYLNCYDLFGHSVNMDLQYPQHKAFYLPVA